MRGTIRAGRYAFRPWASGRAELERRDQPSAGLGRFDGTVVGQYRPTSASADRGATIAGVGRDTRGRSLTLRGDLGASSAPEKTVGTAVLTGGKGRYAFHLTGPKADLSAPSGLANLTFTMTRSTRPNAGPVVARGSMQVNWHPGTGGTTAFTAAIHADPVAANGKPSR